MTKDEFLQPMLEAEATKQHVFLMSRARIFYSTYQDIQQNVRRFGFKAKLYAPYRMRVYLHHQLASSQYFRFNESDGSITGRFA